MRTSPPSDSTPTSTTNQDPSSPPAALTVVLSVACGAVAICILLTIVLLLLRHRSYKQAFRQGQRASFRASAASVSAADKAPAYISGGTRADSSSDGTAALTLNTPDAVVAYLPILHNSYPSTETLTPAGHRTLGPGRALSLTYPKRVHLGLSRSGMGMSLPSQIV
ncbi:hypothetical protein DFH94DRAFT_764130 [Russula ochroleuca]|uniref:Uncharacterized protein n=1 Tax=Russula ochroleuca TaxID=152965 RepID=A0A9P5K1K6_9AGAM|nr:hypothetical protein DFH94DRAFT_764130 [Russula ochroleuca]